MKPTRQKPEILQAETIARSRLFEIERLHLRFANGNEREYERFRTIGQGAVMVIPLLDQETILLIREYAAGLHAYELTLPKGLIDAGETIEQAANRELREEIGYGANSLTTLMTVTAAPGYHSSRMTLVLAQDLYEERLLGDEPEELEVIPWPLADIATLLQRDDFSDARSIAALYLARDYLQQET